MIPKKKIVDDHVMSAYVHGIDGSGETYVEDLETGDIQHTDKVLPLLLGVQGLVTLLHQPLEQPVEHRLRHSAHGVGYLVLVTTLSDELVTDLDPWLQQVLVKIGTVAAKQLGHALTLLKCDAFLSLANTRFLAMVASSQIFFLLKDAKDAKRRILVMGII